MAWQLRGSPKTVRVTNKLAKEWAEMEAAHVDRPLSERRLQVYEKMLTAGAFRPVAWAKAFCKETGDWCRVNGKHTSTLFSNAELAKVQDVYAVLEEYECDTMEDVAKLYATFDSRAQTRTVADINRSFAAVIPELKDFDAWTISLLVSSLSYANNPTDSYSAKGQPAERAEALFDNVEICLWVMEVLGYRGSRASIHLCRVPVVAAMMNTWRKSKAAATEFWAAVRDETGPNPDVPDRKVAKWLTVMKIDKMSYIRGQGRKGKTAPREFYARCITAWNAWRAGSSTDLKYYADAKLPAIK